MYAKKNQYYDPRSPRSPRSGSVLKGDVRIRAVLILGTIIIGFDIYGYFVNGRYANLANEFLTLYAAVIAIVALCFGYLFSADKNWSRHKTEAQSPEPHAKTGPPIGETIYAQSKSSGIPVIYGAAFLASAVLGFIGTFILLASSTSNTSQSTIAQASIFIVVSCALLVVGLPGFHALQSARARYYSAFGSILWAASSITAAMSLWAVASDGLYQGGQVNQSYHGLNILSNWLAIFASFFIAAAIIRAGAYPPWAALVIILNIFLSFVWIAGANHGGSTTETVYRLDALVNFATRAVFAWYMLKSNSQLQYYSRAARSDRW